MATPHRQVTPSRLLVLPAELRNRVYLYLIDDKPLVQRLVLSPQPPTDSRIRPGLRCISPMSQVCKQLRQEYLPFWMSHLHAGVSTKDIPIFLNTFCRTMYVSGTLRTLCPQRITGYFPGNDKGPHAIASPAVDILPLLKSRLGAPGSRCLFAAEPLSKQEQAIRYERILDALMHNPTSADTSDFTSLLGCDNKDWVSLVRSEHLSKVLLYPYRKCHNVNVTLVFHDAPKGIRLTTTTNRCYVPKLRRLGLEEVYRNTRSLAFGGKLEVQIQESGTGSWDQVEPRYEDCVW